MVLNRHTVSTLSQQCNKQATLGLAVGKGLSTAQQDTFDTGQGRTQNILGSGGGWWFKATVSSYPCLGTPW